MDEEQNNNGQDMAEKVQNNINDAQNIAKDGTNLAKNVGTGNVFGAVKSGFNLLKNKKVRTILIVSLLIPIILIVSIASFFFGILDSIGDAIQNVMAEIKDFFTLDGDGDGQIDGEITITDEQIQLIIDNIEALGVDMDDLYLMGDIDYENPDLEQEKQEATKKYIREFFEAQAVTENLYFNLDGIFDKNKTYGTVYVYRESGNIANDVNLDEIEPMEEETEKETEKTEDTENETESSEANENDGVAEETEDVADTQETASQEKQEQTQEEQSTEEETDGATTEDGTEEDAEEENQEDEETQNQETEEELKEKAENITQADEDELLKYMPYDEMKAYADAGNIKEVEDYFSIDESTGKLVIPSWTETTINGSTTTTVRLKNYDYKNIISQYTTSMNFFIYLAMTVQNPEFVSAVADLVKNSKIEITVFDNYSERTTTETHTTVVNTKGTELKTTDTLGASEHLVPVNDTSTSSQTTITTTKTTTPNPKVTYVKTWFSEQTILYTKVEEPYSEGPTTTYLTNEAEPADPAEGSTVSWTVETLTSKTTGKTIKYEEFIRGKVEDRTGEKGSQGVDDKNGNNIVDNNDEVDDNTTFIGLLDNKFKIPNSSRKEAAGTNLVSGAEIFFHLLQKDASLQHLEQMMRYILYKYTGRDYGVTEFDFNIFDAKEFRTLKSAATNLSTYLRQFSHSGEAPQSEDGEYYLMYSDANSSNGNPTIGNADILWSVHHEKFDIPGKVLQNGVETEVDSVSQYVNSILGGSSALYSDAQLKAKQIYVEKELVDEIGDMLQEDFYNTVLNHTEGLDLTRQQLFALTAVCVNPPSFIINGITVNGVKGVTFREVYEAGLELYEKDSWEHNKYIWDNWWVHLGYETTFGPASGVLKGRDASFETYVKGTFDFSQSEVGEGVFGRQYYMFFSRQQLLAYPAADKLGNWRESHSDEEIFTMEYNSGSFEADYTDGRVNGYYTSSMGRTFTILNQNYISGWGSRCNRAASAIVVSGYSDKSADELINDVNYDYDYGSHPYGGGVIPGNHYWNDYGLEVTDEYTDYGGDMRYEELLAEQLSRGGYALVWIAKNGYERNILWIN